MQEHRRRPPPQPAAPIQPPQQPQAAPLHEAAAGPFAAGAAGAATAAMNMSAASPAPLYMRMNAAAYWQHVEQPALLQQAALQYACAHMQACAMRRHEQERRFLFLLMFFAQTWKAPNPCSPPAIR